MPLPPLPQALALIQEYLDHYNHVMPIFHPPTIVTLLGQQYSDNSRNLSNNSAWWISLNVMLALAQRRRVELKHYAAGNMEMVWGYVQNAMDVLLDVTLRCTSLCSIQALLVLALFFLGTPDSQMSFSLTGCAVRNSEMIGLNIAITHPNFTLEQIIQRKRVFWVTAILEQAASHRAGRPATLALQDREIDIPPEIDYERIGIVTSSDGSSKTNLFRMMAHIATIESKTFQKLYSSSKSGRTGDEINNIIRDLDKDLKAYKKSIPASFNVDNFGSEDWFKP
ncbi:transcriptional regulatory protein [Phlyctema vagabunda]|uniref:Transcriptional regulatory protein n=1 Tax=Phlyctema vagabunda TaxID=108571 RepID=A0ABR4PNJ1_9HELO